MEINWNLVIGETVTQLMKIFIPLLIALIVHWIGDFFARLKESNPDLATALALAAQIGYSSAEEHFRNHPDSGNDKLEYAVSRAEEYLSELGLTVDLHVVRDAILNYGVSTHQFSWTWKSVGELLSPSESKEEANG